MYRSHGSTGTLSRYAPPTTREVSLYLSLRPSQLDAEVVEEALVGFSVADVVSQADPLLVGDRGTAAVEANRILADGPAQAIRVGPDCLEDRLCDVFGLRRVAKAGGEELAVAAHDRLIR